VRGYGRVGQEFDEKRPEFGNFFQIYFAEMLDGTP
jgi:hypothetical protein